MNGSTRSPRPRGSFDRRRFLQGTAAAGALAAAGPSLSLIGPARAAAAPTLRPAAFEFEEATIADLQGAMTAGSLTSRALTQAYIGRIDEIDLNGIQLNSVLEINPDALAIADELDIERSHGHVRGPLHGIPVLIKDNIATLDRMETTAGSLALLGAVVPRDAFMAKKLRAAGAVILGKTNLSEWANFRSFQSSSGWSGRAGQCLNPYVLDHNPCGSSSGTGAAISASLAAGGLGTETDGSIVCPSSANALVGIKVTLGLTSRSGVIPIAHSQDVVGPMCRTVADAATMLGPLTGVDPLDPATRRSRGHSFPDYRRFLDAGALRGARIGVWREGVFGFSPEGDEIAERAIDAIRSLGATVVDPANIPNVESVFDPEFTVLLFEFKADLNAYLSQLSNAQVHSLQDLIVYDRTHAGVEMPWFGQEIFLLAQATDGLDDPVYLDALAHNGPVMRRAIARTLAKFNLDAIVSLTGSPPWTTDLVNGDHFLTASSTPSAVAGYPNVTVPAGYSFGELPVGISFIGTAWSEPKLISLAYSFEQGTKVRHAPTFDPTFAVKDFVPRAANPAARSGATAAGASATKGAARKPAGL